MADEMTDEELRRAVAERLGWKWYRISWPNEAISRWDLQPPTYNAADILRRVPFPVSIEALPFAPMSNDYINNLNTPHFSTSIADAWALIEDAEKRGFCYSLHGGTEPNAHWAEFQYPHVSKIKMLKETTAPRAICLAFLKMTEVAAHG